ARRHARAGARADRPRHRRRHAAGNRRQHPRGADRGETRQRRSAPATLDPSAARARTKSEVRSLRPVASLLVRGGTIVTMNDRFDVVHGDVSIKDGRIAALGSNIADRHDRVVDARGGYILPGLIQTHLHLCQTLFRGYADDLPLMDWLRSRVWPMEAAHTPASLRAAARLATTELLANGTTAVLTMETVHDTDVVFDEVARGGIRATIGKCMMDFDAEVRRRLQEETRRSIDESLDLRTRWHSAANGRIHAAFAPRFAVSCSRELLETVAGLSDEHQTLVHTHAAE